jgi:hypothetical protein
MFEEPPHSIPARSAAFEAKRFEPETTIESELSETRKGDEDVVEKSESSTVNEAPVMPTPAVVE